MIYPKNTYALRKDCPTGSWLNHQPNSAKQIKGGCRMIITGIKDLIKRVRFTGFTINLFFVGLNFAGGSS